MLQMRASEFIVTKFKIFRKF